ncbi:hypothetical protein PG996_008431 [Apiospora saccharicola]|uniref:No apical meristem-associated C-terminal domain-containing protein n=1 Tax=Apiospora saccharicola TaxID=335842 RepID=A0ABR1UXW4_9PEZI
MAENKIPQFTQRDMEISAKAWACLIGDAKSNPQIDFNKLAILGGYKNAASARECWRTTKIRLMAAAGVDKDGNSKGQQDQPETPSGKASKTGKPAATKRKRTKAVPTPTKTVDSGDEEEEVDVGDGSPVPPKKVRRGAATTPGGGRKKKAINTEETVIEPIFDAGEEQQMQQLKLFDTNSGSIEDEVVGVDAMIKAEEQHNAQMSNAFDEV